MLDKFKVSLPDGRAGRITEEAFKAEPIATNTQMLDAAYTYVLAINSLLNENVPLEDQLRMNTPIFSSEEVAHDQ